MNKINQIVRELLDQHEGGRQFFDALDDMVRHTPELMTDLLMMIMRIGGICTDYYIVSGKFGRVFKNYCSGFNHVIVVNGGLRDGEPIDNLEYMNLEGKKFTFVDDSFYKGRTRDAIRKELERNGATLERTIVVYDGSYDKDETVHSLYRYYHN